MNTALLTIDNKSTKFTFSDKSVLILDIGYETLANRYFKKSIPTAYETEMAIIAIEDAIEKIHPKWQWVNAIMTDNKQIKLLANYMNQGGIIETDQLEGFFNRVADIISGSPTREHELPNSVEFIAILLIVREILHHLDIKQLKII